jgi:hypothetical protein
VALWYAGCAIRKKKKPWRNVMKIEFSLLAALLLAANEVTARVAVQGAEQALVSTALEWSMTRLRGGAGDRKPNVASPKH